MVAADTWTGSDGSVCSAVMLAYWLSRDPITVVVSVAGIAPADPSYIIPGG